MQPSRDDPQRPLRILHLEDDPNDALLVSRALATDGLACDITPASSRNEFTSQLSRGGFDLILSDYKLPGFDGLSALGLARQKLPEVPFILVSGTIGEEAAIESLRAGATDYVLKHRLTRLAPTVRRALNEVEERRQRSRLEQQFLGAQKMEAVGRLAGGVAHDFNNLLTVINGYSHLLLARLDAQSPLRPELSEIRKAGERAASLTRQLLAFSRRQVLEPKVLDINPVVLELEKMLRRLIGENIELVTDLAPGLGRVKIDPGQIEQVIMNLVVNARDAMPEGGQVTLQTRGVEVSEEDKALLGEIRPGSYVTLSVADNGCGMDREVQSHIFEPFFTTKEQGKGTGLGLATVYGIVKQSGGSIWVDSEPGRGSTFRIHLPLSREQPQRTPGEEARVEIERGHETILVVEDDPGVRGLIEAALTRSGYTVLPACGPGEARDLCQKHPGRIHLLLTDIVMPETSGHELAKALMPQRPDMGVLFMSGYTDESVLAQGGPLQAPFLQKPFSPERLAQKVREVLGTSAREPAAGHSRTQRNKSK